MKSKLSPSMMCGDYADLMGTLRKLEEQEIEYLHIDIMDGQFVPNFTLGKIKRLREYLDQNGYGHIEIEVDGNVNFPNAKLMREAGANIFVAGSSSIFRPDVPVEENIKILRNATNEEDTQ